MNVRINEIYSVFSLTSESLESTYIGTQKVVNKRIYLYILIFE